MGKILITFTFTFTILILIFYLIKTKSYFMKNEKVYTKAYSLAINYLNNVYIPEKAAVMFDIDDTLLYVKTNNTLVPIKPMIKLLKECLENGLLVLIITARDSRTRKETERDLYTNGITYSYLHLRESPQEDHHLFKANKKRELYQDYGITTIMSIGDNLIDIEGEYSGYGIKLPNKEDPRLYHVNTSGKLVQT